MDRLSWALIYATAALAFTGAGPCRLAATEVGQTAPPLIVRELDGQSFDLSAQRGKVALIDFWATWCPPCRQEMPVLDAVYRRYRDQGLAVIGVSVDSSHDRSAVEKVMQAFTYPAAMMRDATANGFGTPSALPILYVVDAAGVVRAKLTPDKTPVTEDSLTDIVVRLLPRQAAIPPPANGLQYTPGADQSHRPAAGNGALSGRGPPCHNRHADRFS